MAGKNIELLLISNVEGLGIVGDIVRVKPGHARNYLLPHGLAEVPTPAKQKALEAARAEALAEQQALRQAREELLGRMQDLSLTIQRSCNDQGVLYGSVTQRDVSDALQANGYDVGVRSVRLSHSIRRVGQYDVPVQFEADLRTEIALTVEPDRTLEDEREEMDFDEEGNLIEPGQQKRGRGRGRDRDRQPAGEPSEQPAKTAPAADAETASS